MANTSIKRYDKLPSARGLKDIDAIRANFSFTKKKLDRLKKLLDEEVEIQRKKENANDNKKD